MKMDARPPVLGTDALHVSVGARDVCRGLDFTLQPADTLVILGRNGAGKSTLLHTLAGLRVSAVLPLDDTDRALQLIADTLPLQIKTYTPWLVVISQLHTPEK